MTHDQYTTTQNYYGDIAAQNNVRNAGNLVVSMTRLKTVPRFGPAIPRFGPTKDKRMKSSELARSPHDGKLQCPKCPKTFSCLGNLKRHLPQHTGHFKFWCEICRKGFSTQKNMEDHKRKHEGKLHVCEYCTKAFQSRRGLDFHLPEHTGKYPFTCGICSRGFCLRSKLEAHENEHRGKGFACMRCSKVFYTEKEFEKHQQKCS